jgi:hypothetical protein
MSSFSTMFVTRFSAFNLLNVDSQMDSFLSILYPHNPESWKTDFAPLGAFKAYLLADKKAPLPSYLTEQVEFHYNFLTLQRPMAEHHRIRRS